MQTTILKDTLNVLATATTPGVMVDLPYQWSEPFAFEEYHQKIAEMLEEEGQTEQEWKPK